MDSSHKQQKLELTEELESLQLKRAIIEHRIGEIEALLTALDDIEIDSQKLISPTGDFANELWPENELANETIKAFDRLITRQNTLEDKYELFIKLFAGRPDVHAIIWESGEGYSPDCANSFVRNICAKRKDVPSKANCIECEHKQFKPLSLEHFKAHVNTTDGGWKTVLGAYPLDAKDNCKFIVADFDGKPRVKDRTKTDDAPVEVVGDAPLRAQLMAKAFRATCNAAGVPVSMEISRSGKGYHVWLFFSDWVAGSKARRLFTALWTRTMENNAGLDFSVYDRFIPCQDTVSNMGLQGGIGNLVALPFQGQVGNQHTTVFLDEDFRFYSDQWEYLSNIAVMSPDSLDRAIQRVSPTSALGELFIDETDEDFKSLRRPWEKSRPEPTLSKLDAECTVGIIKANMIYIEKRGLSTRAQSRIKRLTAFRNKEFYRKQNMRLSTYDEPRIISVAQENDDYLILPRGAEQSCTDLLTKSGIDFAITDNRVVGTQLDIVFTGKLTSEQTQAAESMLQHELGVLSAAPGFGKTVVGAYLIANRAVNTLVLVHRQDLYDQWKSELDRFLEIKNKVADRTTKSGRKKKQNAIGEYAGIKDWRSGLVDVAMIQSLYRKGCPPDFIKDYGMVIIDEAHHATAGSFETVLQHANARYVYGLTATPARKDGRQPILFLECGPIRFKTDAREQAERRPFEHFVVPRFTGFQPTSVINGQSWVSVAAALISDEDRNSIIIEDIIDALKSGRNPLVLSERREHALHLADKLSSSCDNVITLIGGRSPKTRREASNQLKAIPTYQPFVIVGTGQLIGEGFDYPRLDTLFVTMPISWKGKVSQYIGRLHRTYEGKEDVRIYDYIDTSIVMLENMYRKRLAAYKANGYSILPSLDASSDKSVPNIIFGKDDYWDSFWHDCEHARKELVIASSRIVDYRVERMLALPQIAQGDIAATVYTEDDEAQPDEKKASLIDRLVKSSIQVISRQNVHHCLAIIDQSIIWYGSIKLLGHATKHDTMIRIVDENNAKKLLAEVNASFR